MWGLYWWQVGAAEILKGILRLRMTARTKMLMAVFALMPNCSQSESKITFCWLSILTVIDTCAIIEMFNINTNAALTANIHQNGAK